MTASIRTIALFGAPLAALALLGACQQAAPPAAADTAPDTAKVAAEVRAVAAEIIAAYNAHDAKKTAAYDAPDYLGLNHGTPAVHGEQQRPYPRIVHHAHAPMAMAWNIAIRWSALENGCLRVLWRNSARPA